MSQLPYLPFADYFQNLYPMECVNYDPCFKKIYPKPIFMKGVKKIQSLENFKDMAAPINNMNQFKKINSVDNFIPEDYELDLNPLYAIKEMNNTRMGYNESTKGKNLLLKKKLAGEADFRIKYKTEVCKYWATYQYCEFGDQCAFAHGKEEIREKIHISTNYKTKKCIQFHENLYCPYGQRCQFLHSLANIKKDKDIDDSFSYVSEMENLDQLPQHDNDCFCCAKRPRLPTFTSITNSDINDMNEKILTNLREQGSTRSCSEIGSDSDDIALQLDVLTLLNKSNMD